MFRLFGARPATAPLSSDPSIRRSTLSPDELVARPFGDEITTLGDIFAYGANKSPDKVAAFHRDIVHVIEEKKTGQKADGSGEEDKVWKYFTLTPPKPVTFRELDTLSTSLTHGLLSLPLFNPSTPIGDRPRASIYADTSLRWQLMAQAFARLGVVITTAYTTLGLEGLVTSLVEPDVEIVFCGEGQVERVSDAVKRAEKVKWVVFDGEERVDKALVDEIQTTLRPRGGRVMSFTQLLESGKSHPLPASELPSRPTSDDLHCIMYTSGSTGPPKGVLLTHGNIIAGVSGAIKLWGKSFDPKSDVLLAYLPLAHILAQAGSRGASHADGQFLEYTMYILGVPMAYANIRTLLDDSVRNCQGDFAAYRPTLMGGVPAVFEMIRKGMMKKINEAGPIVGGIFAAAVIGKQTLPWPLKSVIDRVLFARVKQATGGRLRIAVCGGGALSKDTQLFLSTVLVPMMQGYGMTETCGMTSITTEQRWSLGSVGDLGPSCELKLADQRELGYLSSNTPPQGEIWLRGPNVFKGYFKQEDLTRESFTSDGWFKTGDVGQIEANGTLTIIDRVKNLVKLQNGEYVALDKLESIYRATDVIMMLCIHVSPGADQPIAIVYPHEGNLRALLAASHHPLATSTPQQWAFSRDISKLILRAMLDTGKKGGLEKGEMIKGVVVTPEEWSPDNGMLTPAMKVARPVVAKRFEKEIAAAE